MELSKIARITNILLHIFLVCGVISLFGLYQYVELFVPHNKIFYKVFFVLIAIVCLMIVYQVIKVFKSISKGDPFVTENEIALKTIAVLCEIIAIMLFLKLFFDRAFMVSATVVMIIFAIVGLCAYVFSQLFKQSVHIKEENDMTI